MPKDYQQMIWDGVIAIGVIRELEQLFNGVECSTPEKNPEIFSILDRVAKEKGFGAMQAREALRPYLEKLRGAQVEKAIFDLIDSGKINNFRDLEKSIIKEYVNWVKKAKK